MFKDQDIESGSLNRINRRIERPSYSARNLTEGKICKKGSFSEPVRDEIRPGDEVDEQTAQTETHNGTVFFKHITVLFRNLAADDIRRMETEPADDARIEAFHAVQPVILPQYR